MVAEAIGATTGRPPELGSHSVGADPSEGTATTTMPEVSSRRR